MKKMCTGLIAGLIIGVLLTSVSGSFAASPIKLVINGKQIICDTPPQLINDRVMVPARFIAEPLGATVTWDGANQTVNITSNNDASNNVQGTVEINPDKQEFLALSTEADALIEKYESRIKNTITENEGDIIQNEMLSLMQKFAAWGELYPYTNIKNIYVATLKDLGIAAINKAAMNSPYATSKYESEYERYMQLITTGKNKIIAEKTRLEKLGYL